MNQVGNWIPPEDVMKLLGIQRANFNRMCRDGIFGKGNVKKIGRTWYVHVSVFE